MGGRSRHRRLGMVELLLMMVVLHSHPRILQTVQEQEKVQEMGQRPPLRRCTTSVASDDGMVFRSFQMQFPSNLYIRNTSAIASLVLTVGLG